MLTIRAEIAKNQREHRLPLSDFLFALLSRRRPVALEDDSAFVFPGRSGNSHLVDPCHVILQITKQTGIKFIIHDLRRVFLCSAEKLDVPNYALKKLANHVSSTDVTAGYLVIDVERLRGFMQKITDHLVALLGADKDDLI